MELKIAQVEIPEIIDFNYEELKNEISAKAHDYEVMVYTEDKIKEAKADKAALNKLKKALNDERIKQEKEYMKPFTEFKSRVNEIIGIIDKPVAIIDAQVKEFEEKRVQTKKEQIQTYWQEIENKPFFLKLENIWNPKWTNATYKMSDIETEINERITGVNTDVKTLESLSEFSFEALEYYKTSLDLGASIAEGQRLSNIQKAKEEAERKKQEEAERKAKFDEMANANAEQMVIDTTAAEIPYTKPEVLETPPVQKQEENWIRFEALLSVEKALKLKQFFADNNISFRKA